MQVLHQIPIIHDPNLLVGRSGADDAAVYKISDDLAIVQTVDYFTPIVDDPYTFGTIAAANALSDIYAMGAKPTMALNIVGFPVNELSLDVLVEILRGGQGATQPIAQALQSRADELRAHTKEAEAGDA